MYITQDHHCRLSCVAWFLHPCHFGFDIVAVAVPIPIHDDDDESDDMRIDTEIGLVGGKIDDCAGDDDDDL
jgi:hypothetical protein